MSELNDLLTTRELQRWRLILGEAAETTLCGLDDNARQIDHALEWLYGRDPERLQRGERYGGLGRSNLTTPEWINSIHTLFPQQVIERLESDAVLRYGIEDVVTNLDVLERMQPSESLLRAVLHTKHLMNPEVLAAARRIVHQVVEEIMARLAEGISSGAQNNSMVMPLATSACARLRVASGKVASSFSQIAGSHSSSFFSVGWAVAQSR